MKKLVSLIQMIFIFFILTLFSCLGLSAESPSINVRTLRVETRIDFDNKYFFDSSESEGGFRGKYLNLVLNGDLSNRFKYSYRQRFNVPMQTFSSFFKATDVAYLDYLVSDKITLSGGKQVVAIGGHEYDMAPIDVYFWSGFASNVVCYEMGASVSLHDASKKNLLTFQFCNAPFIENHTQNLYAYNLVWYGQFDHFKPIYSINLLEYQKGKYINYIALGNKFVFNNFSFHLDYFNRASFQQTNFFSNFSLIGEVDYIFDQKFRLFLKGGYDENKSQPSGLAIEEHYDRVVAPGTEFYYGGLGAEYFPLKESKDIRFHTNIVYRNFNSEQSLLFKIGLTWKVNLLSAFAKKN